MTFERFIEKLDLDEEKVSILLGAIIVAAIAVAVTKTLLYNYFRGLK